MEGVVKGILRHVLEYSTATATDPNEVRGRERGEGGGRMN